MNFLLSAFVIFLISFCLTIFLKTEIQKRCIACGGVVVGSLLGIIPAFRILASGLSSSASLPSPIPGLDIALGIDPLSAFFLVAIFRLSGLAIGRTHVLTPFP